MVQFILMTLLFSLIGLVVTATSNAYTLQEWKVELDNPVTVPFYYYWDKCVGSGHAALMLREDWQQFMKQGVDAIGFQQVRGHGILDDDVGSVNGVNDYSFVNIDKIYKHLLSIGMKPYVEISFMPNAFKSNDSTICHYKGNISPANNYNNWYNFIKQWMQHLVDEFGINEVSTWNFEVWNEPNTGFWTGNPKFDTYLQLYNSTALAIKSANKNLKVGGPTICCIDPSWINNFLNATLSKNIPLDFVVFHSYPSAGEAMQSYRNGIQSEINIVESYNSKYNLNLPAFISEYGSICCAPFDGYDDNYAASFLIYNAMYLQKLFPKQQDSTFKFMSYWSISDVFEEAGFNSNEFNGLYGLQTIRGIAKPAFRALELLNKFGGTVSYNTSILTSNIQNNTVLVYCLKNGNDNNRFSVFISNFNGKKLPIQAFDINIYVNNEDMKLSKVTMYRIDADNTNPVTAWKNMSSPTYPTQQQLQKMNDTSQLIAINNVNYKVLNATTIEVSLNVPIYGVVLLDLQY